LARGDVGVIYIPQSQSPEGLTALVSSVAPLAWMVRTAGDTGSTRLAVERAIHAMDAAMPIINEQTMEQGLGDSIARQNFNMMLLGVFAAVALLLAAIGVYGLMAYNVEQRTQEIGIRMALGAERYTVLGLVLKQGLKLALGGVAAGLALAYATTRLLESLLYGVKANDPATFAIVAVILAGVGILATVAPARHASTLNPIEALRYQ
jgi:putative ABC transport system permease protein